MKSEKLKRFRVTQTLRFPSNIMKGFFYAGLVLLPLGLVVAVLSFFVPALEGVRGIAVIAAALSVIWLFALPLNLLTTIQRGQNWALEDLAHSLDYFSRVSVGYSLRSAAAGSKRAGRGGAMSPTTS